MIQSFSAYYRFLRVLAGFLVEQRGRVFAFAAVSVLASLTEGIGVSLLAPVLESMGDGSAFAKIPILGKVTSFFAGFEPSERLRWAASAMLVMILARGMLLYMANLLAASIPMHLRYYLTTALYDSLLETRLSFVLGSSSGALLNNLRSHPERVASLVGNVCTMAVNLLVVSIYLMLMVAISPGLTAAALLFMYVVSKGVRRVIQPRITERGRWVSTCYEDAHQTMQDTMHGIKQIYLSVAQGAFSARFRKIAKDELDARMEQERLKQAIGPVFVTSSGGLICALIFSASVSSSIDVGAILMFMFLLFRLMNPVTSINTAIASIHGDIHALEEVGNFRQSLVLAREPSGSEPVRALNQGIEFRDVTFTYPGAAEPTLRDVSFSIRKGSMVALVGPSGAGKSTLINLLARFQDPSEGVVLVDGIDLRTLNVADWRHGIGLVSQESLLFNGTIRNNIAFARPGATDQDIRAAAGLAAIDDFIVNELPEGYDSPVGERGVRLSGGQQQRLSLARAILADPQLLILDEATSNLDSITEHAVQNAIEHLRKTRTLVVIAHRLATIQHADMIVLVNGGRVLATGSHAELFAKSDLYRDMITHQRLL